MMRTLFLLLILLQCTFIEAQEKYAVSNISSPLVADADVVIRNDNTTITVHTIEEISYTFTHAITILNERGANAAMLSVPYDKFAKVNKIKGWLYDDKGVELKKLKNSEIKDRAIYDFSLIEDNRLKEHNFYCGTYPYTVVYEVEVTLYSLFYLDEWVPQDDYNTAVESASIEIQIPAQLSLRHKTFHMPLNAEQKESNGIKTIKLSCNNIAAIKKPNMAPYEEFPFPTLAIAPDTFIIGGVPGNLNTWNSLGKFDYELNKDRDALPDNIKKIVHQLTDSCTNIYSKVSLLYEYLKSTTRYVSIQLGIGGWQSFDAKFVAEKGYGDCKALSNYMKALLKEADVSSNIALVKAGKNNKITLNKDFAHNTFNHIIVCVPNKQDTIWLECTAKTLPAGYLSNFTADRDVLIIGPSGGKIAHTPVYNAAINFTKRTSTLQLNENGEIEGEVKTIYSGEPYDEENDHHYMQAREKTEKYLNSQFNLPSYKVKQFRSFTTVNNMTPQLTVNTTVAGTGNVMRSGKRLFIKPHIADIIDLEDAKEQSRTTPFALQKTYLLEDTGIYVIPTGNFKLESLPEEKNYVFAFGEYHSKYAFIDNNKIKVTRYYKQKGGQYPASEYPNYLKLLKEVNVTENQKQVVLLKND